MPVEGKRRRLTGKTTPTTAALDYLHLLGDAWRDRECKWRGRSAFAASAASAVAAELSSDGYAGRKRALWTHAFKVACNTFGELPPNEQARWVYTKKSGLQATPKPSDVASIVAKCSQTSPQALPGGEQPTQHSQVGFLVTFNGSWGLQDAGVQDTMLELHEVAAVTAKLQLLEGPKKVFDDFWTQMEAAGERIGLKHVSASMELSTKARAAGRLHLHAFFSFLGQRTRTGVVLTSIRFDGQPPSHISLTGGGDGVGLARRGRAGLLHQGHFYLQMRKVGSLHRRTNYAKGVDFPVRLNWILLQWQQRKISHKDARLEVIDSRDKVQRGLQAIEQQERAEAALAAEAKMAQVGTPALLPFKQALPLEVEWLRQYSALDGDAPEGRRWRFKCLVYDGPSRTGKTMRAMNWFGRAQTLRLNCQKVVAPSMQRWVSGQHSAILFDEGNWDLVHSNKMLFQAGPEPVELGQSPCGAYVYTVNVFAVPMVVCSNAFWAGCPAVGDEREWLEENIFYVRWDTPVFEAEAGQALPAA